MSQEFIELFPLLFAVVMLAPLCIGVTRAAAEGWLLCNGGAGIRTKKTTRSQAAWQAGHQAALPIVSQLWSVAAGTVVMAVAVQWWSGGTWGIIVGLAGLFGECVVLFWAAHVAGQAAEQVP